MKLNIRVLAAFVMMFMGFSAYAQQQEQPDIFEQAEIEADKQGVQGAQGGQRGGVRIACGFIGAWLIRRTGADTRRATGLTWRVTALRAGQRASAINSSKSCFSINSFICMAVSFFLFSRRLPSSMIDSCCSAALGLAYLSKCSIKFASINGLFQSR